MAKHEIFANVDLMRTAVNAFILLFLWFAKSQQDVMNINRDLHMTVDLLKRGECVFLLPTRKEIRCWATGTFTGCTSLSGRVRATLVWTSRNFSHPYRPPYEFADIARKVV